jgi:hypothetical protein
MRRMLSFGSSHLDDSILDCSAYVRVVCQSRDFGLSDCHEALSLTWESGERRAGIEGPVRLSEVETRLDVRKTIHRTELVGFSSIEAVHSAINERLASIITCVAHEHPNSACT